MKKSTDIEVQNRIDYIIELIVSGITGRKDILQYVTDKFDVKVRQIDNYIREARNQIKETHRPRRDERISTAILRYELLIKKNMDLRDYREARACQNDLNRLLGLIVEKVELSQAPIMQIALLSDLSDEEE